MMFNIIAELMPQACSSSISTDMIQKNLKKVVKAQKLSDDEMDDMLKRLLYKKLCMDQSTKPAKTEKPKKKANKKKVQDRRAFK